MEAINILLICEKTFLLRYQQRESSALYSVEYRLPPVLEMMRERAVTITGVEGAILYLSNIHNEGTV